MSEKMQIVHPVTDTLSANPSFTAYFSTADARAFEDERERLVRTQSSRIISVRSGFQKSDGTVANAGDPVGVVDAGGMGHIAVLVTRGWLSMIDIALVVTRQAALDAEWLTDPCGPALILPSGIAEPGAAVTQEMCAFHGDSRTIYDAQGNSSEVPLGPPTSDGSELLQQLIAAGRVVPGPGHKGTGRKAKGA